MKTNIKQLTLNMRRQQHRGNITLELYTHIEGEQYARTPMLHDHEAIQDFCALLKGEKTTGADSFNDISYVITYVSRHGYYIFHSNAEPMACILFYGPLLAGLIECVLDDILDGADEMSMTWTDKQIKKAHRPYRSRAIYNFSDDAIERIRACKGKPYYDNLWTRLNDELSSLRNYSDGQRHVLWVRLDGYQPEGQPPSFYFERRTEAGEFAGNGGCIWHPTCEAGEVVDIEQGRYSLHH